MTKFSFSRRVLTHAGSILNNQQSVGRADLNATPNEAFLITVLGETSTSTVGSETTRKRPSDRSRLE